MGLASMTSRQWLLAMAAACFAGEGLALVAQHVFDMQPCPWCILQRVIYLVIAALCIAGAMVTAPLVRKAFAAGALLFALLGAASAVYQNVIAAKLYSCNLTLADKIIGALGLESLVPWLFQVTASCADAAVTVLGVPFEFWSLALFALLAGMAARVLVRAA